MIDTVVRISRKTEGQTLNNFYKLCEKYNLTSEQIQQALAILNGRTRVPINLQRILKNTEKI